MIGIMVFSHRLIIFYALKHFWNILHMAFSEMPFQWHVMTQLDKQDWINQLGESNDFVTHLLNKYVTCTHNAQIRQVSIWKMLPVDDNDELPSNVLAFFLTRPLLRIPSGPENILEIMSTPNKRAYNLSHDVLPGSGITPCNIHTIIW